MSATQGGAASFNWNPSEGRLRRVSNESVVDPDDVCYEDNEGDIRCRGCDSLVIDTQQILYHAFCEEMN